MACEFVLEIKIGPMGIQIQYGGGMSVNNRSEER